MPLCIARTYNDRQELYFSQGGVSLPNRLGRYLRVAGSLEPIFSPKGWIRLKAANSESLFPIRDMEGRWWGRFKSENLKPQSPRKEPQRAQTELFAAKVAKDVPPKLGTTTPQSLLRQFARKRQRTFPPCCFAAIGSYVVAIGPSMRLRVVRPGPCLIPLDSVCYRRFANP